MTGGTESEILAAGISCGCHAGHELSSLGPLQQKDFQQLLFHPPCLSSHEGALGLCRVVRCRDSTRRVREEGTTVPVSF